MLSGHKLAVLVTAAALVAAGKSPAPAQAVSTEPTARLQANQDVKAKANQLISRGAQFLLSAQQADGAFVPEQAPVGMNALALKALVQAPEPGYRSPAVKKGYQKLLQFQVESGGIYKDSLANYNTAIAISALAAANDPELTPAIKSAAAYLKSLQWTDAIAGPEGEKIDAQSPWFGGFGYGGHSRGPGRPDLSNTHMAVEALHDAGLQEDDPAFQNALKFVSRLQNSSESNDQPWAGDDGGFIYSPSGDGQGESMAGEYVGADGKRMLRSYGSMTYAGLKSLIYAGLSKDDPRVKAAWNWIRSNWTLDENPGMRAGNPENAQYGMYYYYHTLARTLRAYGEPVVQDPKGANHDWRVELIDKLAALQRPDGSWSGERKWMEDNPILATSYSLLAIEEAIASLDGK